jgi:DNA gyrase/topoisomerase IV subunit A
MTALQSSFSVNNIALVNGRPRMLNLKDLIHYFVEHRHEVVIRRTQFELAEAEKRAHLLEGFMIILDNLDEAIQIIRDSKNLEEARTRLWNASDCPKYSRVPLLKCVFVSSPNGTGQASCRISGCIGSYCQFLKEILEKWNFVCKSLKMSLSK